MIRGTTTLHTFKFPEDISNTYTNIVITYRQNGNTLIKKQLNNLDIYENIAKLRLTQVETYSFDVGTGYVQVKVYTKDRRVLASPVFSFPVTSSLNDDVFLDNGYIDPIDDISEYKNEELFTIIRGTTPTLYYAPTMCPIEEVDLVYLVVKQCHRIVIEKTKQDAEIINGSIFAWQLSQEETLLLESKRMATISCVWKLTNGIRGESQLTCCKVLDSAIDEVI